MSPTIQQLYNLDATELRHKTYEEETNVKLTEACNKKLELLDALRTAYLDRHYSHEYVEHVSAINTELKHINKTIAGLEQDLAEMRVENNVSRNELDTIVFYVDSYQDDVWLGNQFMYYKRYSEDRKENKWGATINNKLLTIAGAIASMLRVSFAAGQGLLTIKQQITLERYRRGTGTAFTKGKRHRSQKIRANRRKAKC